MTWLVWGVFGLMALLWTGGAWSLAALTGWTAEWLASGRTFDASAVLASWPLPAWLALWVDVTALHAVLDALAWGLTGLRQAGPLMASVAGWLVPLIWVGWALGLALLLAAAAGLHLLVRRVSPPAMRPA